MTGEVLEAPQGTFWVIERSDIPWGSKPAGVTLYRSKRLGETWTDNIYHAAQFASREGAEVWHKSREASDPALRVVEHAWIATDDVGSNAWWTVRRVANGDVRRPWYELTDEDRQALRAHLSGGDGEEKAAAAPMPSALPMPEYRYQTEDLGGGVALAASPPAPGALSGEAREPGMGYKPSAECLADLDALDKAQAAGAAYAAAHPEDFIVSSAAPPQPPASVTEEALNWLKGQMQPTGWAACDVTRADKINRYIGEILAALSRPVVGEDDQGRKAPEGWAGEPPKVGDRVTIQTLVSAVDESGFRPARGWHSNSLILRNDGPNMVPAASSIGGELPKAPDAP